jgi:hypothetical protein
MECHYYKKKEQKIEKFTENQKQYVVELAIILVELSFIVGFLSSAIIFVIVGVLMW